MPAGPLRALPQPRRLRRGALATAVTAVLAALTLTSAPIPARASAVDDYTNAVHRALTLVQFAERGDAPSVQQAIIVLKSETGGSQPEVLRDLRKTPPDLVAAEQRLRALYDALQTRVDTPDPALARQQLQRILSQSRYSGLGSGSSLVDQAIDFIVEKAGELLSILGLNKVAQSVPVWIWLLIGLIAVLAIIVWPIRGGLSRGGREARAATTIRKAAPSTDFFREADRLAANHDYVGAIKALAGGVAVRLRGEQVWDRSPLTVREVFAQSERADALRPLLRSFEEASYGHRSPDAAAYARASESAAPFRKPA